MTAGFSQKHVFITGATGSVGLMLARRLSAAGQKVRAIVRDPLASAPDGSGASRSAALSSLPGVEVVKGDLSQPEGLRGLMRGCGLVYHIAAKVQGSDRAAYQAINVAGTKAILNEAITAGVDRFVYISTIGVYGMVHGQDLTEDAPWLASDWRTSRSPYIATKQEAERLVWTAGLRMPVTVARPGDIYGPQQYAWTVQFIEKINQGQLMPPTDAASGLFNLIYIDNLVDALLLLGSHPQAVGQAFNVVDGAPMPVSDYIRAIASMAGKHPPAVPALFLRAAAAVLMAADRIRGREAMVTPNSMDFLLHKWTISGAKLRSMLGWSPAVGREEAFHRIAAWLHSAGYIQ